MDWNWFYSAIAQSAAAIVGIFAAFIITKIINNQAIFAQRCQELNNLIYEADIFREYAQNLDIDLYNDTVRRHQLSRIPNIFRKYAQLEPSKSLCERLNFSPYENYTRLTSAIESSMNESEQLLGSKRGTPPILKADQSSNLRKIDVLNSTTAVIQSYLVEIHEEINSLRPKIQDHAKRIRQFNDEHSKHPQSSSLITISILFVLLIFWSGVMLPLFLLPQPSLSQPLSISDLWDLVDRLMTSSLLPLDVKASILLCVGTIFTVAMLLFGWINAFILKMKKDDLSRLKERSEVSFYSEYFSNFYNSENVTNFVLATPDK